MTVVEVTYFYCLEINSWIYGTGYSWDRGRRFGWLICELVLWAGALSPCPGRLLDLRGPDTRTS